MNHETTIEPLGVVADRQAIITSPMREMLAKYGPGTLVEVTTRHTAFGSFLMRVEVVS
jgi:hypothetical protein